VSNKVAQSKWFEERAGKWRRHCCHVNRRPTNKRQETAKSSSSSPSAAPTVVLAMGHRVSRLLFTSRSLRDSGSAHGFGLLPNNTGSATKTHHVKHWVDSGTTSLLNLALLCAYHHSWVHQHDLTATVTAQDVTWQT
jgi:hypothetical protein